MLSWANFAEGFLVENCQSCHASTSVDRHGAPAGVVFDTLNDALEQAARIGVRAAGDDATMPPAGGISEEDRALLAAWLACGEPGAPYQSTER